MGITKRPVAEPPQAPSIKTRFQIPRFQLIGMPLVMLIPILALFGIFGESVDSVSASNPQLEMRVEYPTRFRYKMLDSVTVALFNASEQSFPTVELRFDRAYIEAFSTVTFTPSVKSITEEDYIVEVTDLQPQETRIISVTVQAEKYGKHSGAITAAAENAEELRVLIDTLTFP